MNSRVLSSRAGLRRAGLLALVAIFWLAQLQGVSHLVSHLSRDHAAPHALVCGDCIASADAGAAPLSAVPAAVPVPRAAVTAPPPAATPRAGGVVAAYRSRAPPATST